MTKNVPSHAPSNPGFKHTGRQAPIGCGDSEKKIKMHSRELFCQFSIKYW
jgi:hypothetical protein